MGCLGASGAGVVAATGGKAAGGGAGAGADAAGAAAAASAAMEAAVAAGALASAVDAAERKAGESVAAAEARCLALAEMVDSLVAEKVGWEEERASAAAEAMRLRARVRGLEEAVANRGAGGGEDGVAGDRKQALLVEGLRKLLRERTRELEVKSVGTERLGERRMGWDGMGSTRKLSDAWGFVLQ